MDKIAKIILPSLILLLSGCLNLPIPTQENYHAKLNNWIGKTEADLIREWGTPDKHYELSENEIFISYEDSQTIATFDNSAPSLLPSQQRRGLYFQEASGSRTISCKTTFIIVDGIVTKWRTKGQACVSL